MARPMQAEAAQPGIRPASSPAMVSRRLTSLLIALSVSGCCSAILRQLTAMP